MQEKYEKEGVILVALSYEPKSLVAPYVRSHRLPYIVGDDAGKVRDEFGIPGYPTMFLIDPDGKVAWKGHPMEVEPVLKKLLKDNPPRKPPLLLDEAAAKPLAKAEKLLKSKKYAKAYRAYEKIVDEFSGTRAAKKAKARLRRMKGSDRIMAIVQHAEADRNGKRWLQTARTLAKNGAEEDAVRYYRRIIKNCAGTDYEQIARRELASLMRGGA